MVMTMATCQLSRRWRRWQSDLPRCSSQARERMYGVAVVFEGLRNTGLGKRAFVRVLIEVGGF